MLDRFTARGWGTQPSLSLRLFFPILPSCLIGTLSNYEVARVGNMSHFLQGIYILLV